MIKVNAARLCKAGTSRSLSIVLLNRIHLSEECLAVLVREVDWKQLPILFMSVQRDANFCWSQLVQQVQVRLQRPRPGLEERYRLQNRRPRRGQEVNPG